MINLQPETIVGEFQDTFKNIMTINMYAQQVALIQIELEQEPNVYRYTFRMVDGTKLITRVNFDFPYLTTCIFRKNCASVPEERSAIPLQTEQSSAG